MMEYDASAFDDMDIKFEYGCELGYSQVVNTFGYETILLEYLGSWDGDVVAILEDKEYNRYGFLMFGYGSCSGCDALEGTTTMEGLKSLALSLYSDIKWFHSIKDIQDWVATTLNEEDVTPGPYFYYDSDFKEWAEGFIEQRGKAT